MASILSPRLIEVYQHKQKGRLLRCDLSQFGKRPLKDGVLSVNSSCLQKTDSSLYHCWQQRVWAEYAGPGSPNSGWRIAEKQAGRRAERRQIQGEKGSDRRGNGLEEGQEVVSRPGKVSSPGSQHSYKGLRTHCPKSTAQWPHGCGSRNLCRWPT